MDFAAGTIDLSWQLQRIGYRHGCRVKCGKTRAASCPSRELDVRAGDEYRVVSGGLCLTRPKTSAGVRVIPMTPLLQAVLMDQWNRRAGDGLVFTRPDGGPTDYSRDNAAWHRMLDQLGLPQMKLHAARHTTATLLGALGVDERTRTAIMGHSSAAMTRKYQHVDLTMARAALAGVSDLMGDVTDTAAHG